MTYKIDYISEPSTFNPQHTFHVWVYKKSTVPNSNTGNPHGVTIVARSIIERAKVYPKTPSQKGVCFDILWSEISKFPNGEPGKRVTVYFDELAKAALTIDDIYSFDAVKMWRQNLGRRPEPAQQPLHNSDPTYVPTTIQDREVVKEKVAMHPQRRI